MGDKEEEFPFEQFVETLQEAGEMRGALKGVVAQINERNIYWTYSAVSTLVEILRSKDEDPHIKCRALQAAALLADSAQYPLLTFLELYILPLLADIALYRGRKSEELASYYFQQLQAAEDTPENKSLSLQFVERAAELIFYLAKIKPQRTVETEELKQESNFARTVRTLKEKGIDQPKVWKWCDGNKIKDCRRRFLEKMRSFGEESDDWTEFLLVNLLEEVRSGKKELLELRLLLSYGESYLTSAVINVCEDELSDLSDNLDLKRKYLALLNELVRAADIEAIIMIKNSEFMPAIVAQLAKVQGHLGLPQGENILPDVKAPKQVKREFYSDFLRCIETWATVMPSDYDAEDFNIKNVFHFLKNDKKFKFPENMHLARYQKEIVENLERNKERNDKLIEILENVNTSKQQSNPVSKVSNVLQRTTMLAPIQLENRLEETRRSLKDLLLDQVSAEKAIKILTQFKENWITYLEALDLEGADEARLETLVFDGERTVEQIQLVLPYFQNLQKGKLNYREFKDKVKESLDHYNDLSSSKTHQPADKKSIASSKSKSIALSKLIQSKMGQSKFEKSRLGGKELMDKMKSKSKMGDVTKLDLSRVMDRSNMQDRSRVAEKSKIDKSKFESSKKNQQDNLKQSHRKKETPKKQSSSESEEDESVTKSYKVPDKMLKKHSDSINKPTPTTPTKSTSKDNNTPAESDSAKKDATLRKQKIVLETPEKITRIADYEADVEEIELKPQQVSSRLDKSREKGSSRILLRRSHNRSSHKERSEGSEISVEKRSVSSKRVKENSIFKRGPIELASGKKVSEIEEQLLREDKVKVNQTIEINGYDINDRASSDKKAPKLKETNKMANFKDGAADISSIESNSVLRLFHHSAEKILNISAQEQSDLNESRPFTKEGAREVVEHVTKPIATPPLVGDYYQEEANIKSDVELTPKKQSAKELSKSRADEQTSKKDYQLNKEKEQKVGKKIDSSLLRGNFQKPKKEEDKKEAKQPKQSLRESKAQQRNEQKMIKEVRTVKIESIVERHGSTTKLADLKALEEAKNRQIEALHRKIQQLERETVAMKTKLAVKDNELRSIKSGSKSGSQRGFAQFTSPSHSNYDLASSAAKSKGDKTSLRGSSVGKKVQNSRFQKEVQNGFKQYLQRITGSTFRKSLLKLKCLVHKNDEIEIGCLTKRNDKTMECTLFVTPHRYDVLDFAITIIHDHSLKIKTNPEHVKLIPVKKQQKINLSIEILKIPFCLPEFEMNYKSNSEYSSNYNRLTLPIAFNKFCEIMPMSSQSKSQRHTSYVRTDDFKLNGKVIKLEKVSESFPNFTVLPSTKQREQILLAASCVYQQASFNLMMNLHEKVSWIEGFLLEGDAKAMNFLICTLKQVLDGSKK